MFTKTSKRNGALCQALKIKKLQTTEMKMLRMICGKALRDGISNETIHEMTDVKKIKFAKKFGHVERMHDESAAVKAKNFVVGGSKRGRPKR